MGRPDEGQAIVGSSIVILQERFKRLQKLKEMREERRIHQLLRQSTYVNQELVGRDQLALGVNSNQRQSCDDQRKLVQQQPFPSNAVKEPYNFFEKMDVDTSLHL